METVLEMKRITKSFSGQTVLRDVDFDLAGGEVHALVGENGAGKSTLMRILMGEFPFDSGRIVLQGKEQSISSPARALGLGIAMIHQELSPVPEMTIAENVFLGREPNRFGVLNGKKQEQQTAELMSSLGLSFDPRKKMRELSVAETQLTETAKAISYRPRILVMDEPTSAITETEVRKLFEVIRLLRSRGVGVIYISHKIDELFEIADRATILRDGSRVGGGRMADLSRRDLISLMVGRELTEIFPKVETRIGAVAMSVRGLSRRGEFTDISFDLHAGEILGLAGLMGSGRTEIVSTIFGEREPDAGEILVRGRPLRAGHMRSAVLQRIAFVPEDRKIMGLNLAGSVADNLTMVVQGRLSTAGIVRRRVAAKAVNDMIDALSIRVASAGQAVGTLSGGNQQKVVLGKWLLSDPEVVILDEPTRGIDVGAKAEIHKLMSGLAAAGKAVIMISSEMPEVIGMCDRVIVLHEGRVAGELTRAELTQERLMTLASGTVKT
ncbi:MAG TPA: sugar ABC transporter ATP-binding protein [Spirochaetia bacterium]|nr:sugar ABC transporter ATP-binding protein [Spirochaetia bacterium]